MKTVEIECRKYDKWDKATQEKILDKHRDVNVQYEWYIGEYDYWKKLLEKSGYENVEILFTGFSSQGDGAGFIGNIDINKWLESAGNPRYGRIQKLLKSGSLENRAVIKRDRWHNYVHWNTMSIYFDWYGKDHSNIGALLDEIEEAIIKDHQQLNKDIYNGLKETYDSKISDEAVAETLRINEYEFGSDGKIW